MYSSISVLISLLKSKNISIPLENDIEFTKQLLWNLLKNSIQSVNILLEEYGIDEKLDIYFQKDLIFELAINFIDYSFSDEFIEYLIDNKQPDFMEDVAFLKASKNQIIKIERDSLKKHFNNLDFIEESNSHNI